MSCRYRVHRPGLAAALCAPLPAMAHSTDGLIYAAYAYLVVVPFIVCCAGLCLYLYFSRRVRQQKMKMLALFTVSWLLLAILDFAALMLLPIWSMLLAWLLPLAAVVAYGIMYPARVDVPDKP